MRRLFYIFFLFLSIASFAQKKVISGFVLDSTNREPVIGASVSDQTGRFFVVSNSVGFFSIEIDSGVNELLFTHVAYARYAEKELNKSMRLEVLLSPQIYVTQNVNIIVKKTRNNVLQSARINIPIKQIQSIPSILGESDPLKIAQMLPGVQSAGEATPGLIVRGSSNDQNLVLIDDAPIYNPFHLFGIFSVFNSDALKSFEIDKGGFSAEYGGRLASVVNTHLKEGSKTKVSGDLGIGLATSKLLLELPIIKQKASLMLSGRTSYVHLFAAKFLPENQSGLYRFYDMNAKLSAELSPRTKVFLSVLYSGDKFHLNDESTLGVQYITNVKWNNLVTSMRLKHVVSQKLFWNSILTFSTYNLKSNVQYRNNDEYNLLYSTGILDTEFKNDLVWYLNSKHQLKGGVKIGFKRFDPDVVLLKNETIDPNRKIKEYDNFENAIFLEDEMKIGKNLLARLGLRLNSFHASNTFLLNPEPRVSLAYNFKPSWVIKGSYSHMHQYMHMLTNKGVGLPTDLWVPVTDEVPNKKSIQYTLGIQREIPKKNIEVSVETYYKEILNDVSFKEGTSFMQLKKLDELDKDDLSWEKNITTGTSWNYGAEFFIHKKSGRMQGWVAYTMSWAVSKFSDLNFGETFYSRQDRRHNLSIVLIGKISSKISATVNWVYITGNPITLANSAFTYNGSQFQLLYDYSSVNNFRMPAYHRMDAGVTYATFGKKTKRELEFSVYNVYNRFNPYFYYTISTTNVDNTTSFKTNQVSVLPILPSVNYKISF